MKPPEYGILHAGGPVDVRPTGDTLEMGFALMKTLVVCGLVLSLAAGAFAQRRGVGTTFGTNAGYGNVVFPGGKPSIAPFTLTRPNFATSLGNVVAGRPAFHGGVRRQHNSGAVVYVPFAYPVYMGGYYGGYGYGEAPPPPQQPNITVIYPPAQPQPAPVYVAPAEPARPQIQEYTPPAAPETAPAEPAYYLLAFKDHSIYSAVGYWVDGDTLHYITSGNVHNQVSLSLVDRELTEQLNKGRNVQVRLPAPSR